VTEELLERTDDAPVIESKTIRRGGILGVAGVGHLDVQVISSAREIEEVDGVWTVRDLATGIFGTGDSEAAAFRDFRDALIEHRDVLERQDALSAELKSQLEYLRRTLR